MVVGRDRCWVLSHRKGGVALEVLAVKECVEANLFAGAMLYHRPVALLTNARPAVSLGLPFEHGEGELSQGSDFDRLSDEQAVRLLGLLRKPTLRHWVRLWSRAHATQS